MGKRTAASLRKLEKSARDAQKKAIKDGDPPVVVNFRNGCGLCGRTGAHTHRQPDWQEFIDRVGNPVTGKGK